MKCVAVGDIFITPDMMRKGIESFDALTFDRVDYFYFGLNSRSEMRGVVKTIETGGFETLDLPEGLLESVADADVLMCHLCPVTKALLAKAPKLRLVLCNRGGHENIDLKACTERNIGVIMNPSHNANAVADFTVGLMLAETRNIVRSAAAVQRGEWREKFPNTATTIHEMKDMTVGLIGFGAVARLVYEKLRAFGCRFLVSDPFASQDFVNRNIVRFVPLETLLRESDIVSLHARLSRKAILLGEKEFALMKPTAYFINTARSYMVDYKALAAALRTGTIMGAAVDVFDKEPVDPDNPLLGIDNCTLTNHRGGDTINSYSDSPEAMMKAAQEFFEGDRPRYWINPEIERAPCNA